MFALTKSEAEDVLTAIHRGRQTRLEPVVARLRAYLRATETVCLTPGAVFRTEINSRAVTCTVHLPETLHGAGISRDLALEMDYNLRAALELTLSPIFRGQFSNRKGN